MSQATPVNPVYEAHPWTISPNGALYVLQQPSGSSAPPSAHRVGRVLAVSHRTKWPFATGTQAPALVLKVEKAPEEQSSSSADVQSPVRAIQLFYAVGEYNFSPFAAYIPTFKCHEQVRKAYDKFTAKPRDYKQGKWLKDVLKKYLAKQAPDPSLSNPKEPTTTRRTLEEEMSAAAPAGAPSVFSSSDREGGGDQPDQQAELRRRNERIVAAQTSSQPGLAPFCF